MFCELSGLFFLNIFQTSRSKHWVSAKDEKKVVPTLSRVLKSIVQGGNVYSERKLNNAKCILQIIRDISLVKVCLT